jgi:putative FmdB family regulatory protein
MPVYEYECTECNKRFEYMQKITENPKEICDNCKGKLRKLLSHSSFVLKGTGWYKTDYNDNHRKKLNKKISSTGNPIADMDVNVKSEDKSE